MRADLPVGKFTPGPWEWDAGVIPPDGPERYSDIYILDGDGEPTILAKFNDCIPQGRANARLTAAAPELLAACAAFVAACDSAPPTQLIEHIGKCCEQARAAIAKATGAQ